MAWSTSFTPKSAASKISDEENEILLEAKKRFRACEQWEQQARTWFNYDYKFANADSNNMYQWDNWVVGDRQTANRPCLTINKTQQHNLQIINDGKQNKPGVTIRPVGDEASFEAAQVFQEVVRHIEYISSAENVYDNAATFQVNAGWGYWRVSVEKINGTFDKEIFIRRIKDPRSVYLDFNINEVDGSDAWYGFIFDDMPKDMYEAKHPNFKDVGNVAFSSNDYPGWLQQDTVRVAEYYRKSAKPDKLVYFILPITQEEIGPIKWSKLPKEGKDQFNEIKAREGNLPEEDRTYREQDELSEEIVCYKIAGNRIIDKKPWLGKYIPIVRLPGTETVIDGIWDCKGHTRALLDPQRIYNINSSANVEFGALQSKSPLTASPAAIEGHEELYARMNIDNASVLLYNEYDEEGRKLSPPQRMVAPQASPAYVQQMQIAQNEMMMVSGQYQAQMGENENAKSGVAINARQRQGDRATYHFIDNQAIAIRFTGKILIDLIPKIYDTKRVLRIEAKDNSIMNVTIDPKAEKPYEKKEAVDVPQNDNHQQIVDVIFNPSVGIYDVQADTGPSFATRRQEAFNALTQIAAQNKEFMGIAGDILWKVADFPEAQVLAQRWRKIIPKNITGDAMDPAIEETMNQAAAQIEAQIAQIAKLTQELEDKNRDLYVKESKAELDWTRAAVQEMREDFNAMTARLTAVGNAGPGISVEQLKPVIQQTLLEIMQAGGPGADMPEEVLLAPGMDEGGEPVGLPEGPQGDVDSIPEVPGSRQAKDGKHYVQNENGWNEVIKPEAQTNA